MKWDFFVVALIALGAAGAGRAETPPPRAKVADLAWMAGHWIGEAGTGDLSEEVWVPPAGDNMMGMWRWVGEGKAKLFELLVIVDEPDGPVFRLRHFDRAGVGWEDKDQPLNLKLIRAGREEAAFEGTEKGGMVRIAYRREGGALTVTLDRAGKPPATFRFRLSGSEKQ